ncbi:MAG TPA: hypothetical protein VGE59_03475 [Patescibacteria group bacterium]
MSHHGTPSHHISKPKHTFVALVLLLALVVVLGWYFLRFQTPSADTIYSATKTITVNNTLLEQGQNVTLERDIPTGKLQLQSYPGRLENTNTQLPLNINFPNSVWDSQNNQLIILGGFLQDQGKVLPDIYTYSPSQGVVTKKNASLPALRRITSVLWDSKTNKAYILGGNNLNDKGATVSLSDEILVYDPVADTLTTSTTKLPYVLKETTVASIPGTDSFYLIGGETMQPNGQGVVIDTILEYKPITNAITVAPFKFFTKMSGAKALTVPSANEIHLFGGYRANGITRPLILDIANKTSYDRVKSGSGPGASGAIWDESANKAYLFGNALSQILDYTPSNGSWWNRLMYKEDPSLSAEGVVFDSVSKIGYFIKNHNQIWRFDLNKRSYETDTWPETQSSRFTSPLNIQTKWVSTEITKDTPPGTSMTFSFSAYQNNTCASPWTENIADVPDSTVLCIKVKAHSDDSTITPTLSTLRITYSVPMLEVGYNLDKTILNYDDTLTATFNYTNQYPEVLSNVVMSIPLPSGFDTEKLEVTIPSISAQAQSAVTKTAKFTGRIHKRATESAQRTLTQTQQGTVTFTRASGEKVTLNLDPPPRFLSTTTGFRVPLQGAAKGFVATDMKAQVVAKKSGESLESGKMSDAAVTTFSTASTNSPDIEDSLLGYFSDAPIKEALATITTPVDLWIKPNGYLATTIRAVTNAPEVLSFSESRAGDLNNDNTVTIRDFSMFVSKYGTAISGAHELADFTFDNKVDIKDFSIFVSNYGRSGESL